MKMKKTIVGLFLAVFVLGSCYKDKGSYDYNPIPKIVINGIKPEYKVIKDQRLQINPEFSNKEDYKAVWTIFEEQNPTGKVDTVSTSLNLDYLMDKRVNKYTLVLTLENLKNQDVQIFKTQLDVQTVFTSGWYVLKNMNGMTELDHIASDWSKTPNILSAIQGSSLPGKAVGMAYTAEINYVDKDGVKENKARTLWAVSDKGGRMMRIDDMSVAYSLEDAFFSWTPNQTPRGIRQQQGAIAYYSDQGLHNMYLITASAMHRFADRMRISNLSFGDPESYILSKSNYVTYNFTMFYDELNARFLADVNGTLIRFMDYDSKGYPVSVKPNKMNSDILFMGRNENHGYALMKNRTSGDATMYKLDIAGYNNANTYHSPIMGTTSIAASNEVLRAKVYGINAELPYLFYSTGNNLHMYDCDNGKETLNIIPAFDGEVTLIKHVFWRFMNEPRFEYFIVATEKAGRYKIYFYQMLAGKPNLSKEVRVIEGEGAVDALQFADPKMPNFGHGVYPNQ